MTGKKRRIGIIPQVAILFVISVLATGIITFVLQYTVSIANVTLQTEDLAAKCADEVIMAVREYPANAWLMSYWHTHYDELDIEYDSGYNKGTRTENKALLFEQKHPEISLRYADKSSLAALPEEDQKLYAEITYSWLINRVNQIKRAFGMDFLFCVLANESYDGQFFIFSAADKGAKRGDSYEEVYPIGKTASVSESQTEAMKQAQRYSNHLADAGNYVDYYAYLDQIDGRPVFIGLTYSTEDLKDDAITQTVVGMVFAVLYQILLSLLCLLLIWFFVLRPLRKVQKNIRQYKETKESEPVRQSLSKIKSRNEIGQLAEDVTDLTAEMDDYLNKIASITAEKERIGVELSLASRIQASTLPNVFPPFPERSEFDIYASMTPAKEVGGDFYDFFLIDDDHLALLIADVSGTGIPAALFMMVSMIMFQNMALPGITPSQLLKTVNDKLCSNNPEEMFVSVWLGILEISTGKLTAANAGHEYPVIKRPGREFELLKDRHGFVIGGMEGMIYTDYEVDLEPGSKVFLYTDGLPEATDADGGMFGLERMVEALNRTPDTNPEETLKNMTGAVNDFVKDAEQFDDLTMMCMSYDGP